MLKSQIVISFVKQNQLFQLFMIYLRIYQKRYTKIWIAGLDFI